MRALVNCESSGRTREALRAAGWDAWSCDLLPADDGSPFHIQGDAIVAAYSGGWDMMIAHPPCTYLTGAAEWAFRDDVGRKVKPGTLTGEARREARNAALLFFGALLDAPIPRVAIENPVGAVNTAIRKPDQIIHPWMFGDDASKSTCLWLRGLPPLRIEPARFTPPRLVCGGCGDTVAGRPKDAPWRAEACGLCGARSLPRWANQTDSGQNRLAPSADRWKERSATYPGIARAFALNWS